MRGSCALAPRSDTKDQACSISINCTEVRPREDVRVILSATSRAIGLHPCVKANGTAPAQPGAAFPPSRSRFTTIRGSEPALQSDGTAARPSGVYPVHEHDSTGRSTPIEASVPPWTPRGVLQTTSSGRVSLGRPTKAARAGVAVVHQNPGLVRGMSVVAIGRRDRSASPRKRRPGRSTPGRSGTPAERRGPTRRCGRGGGSIPGSRA